MQVLMVSDGDLKTVYRNRNSYYKSIRSERNYPIKKRRLFNCSSVPNYDRKISSEGICVSPERGINGDVSALCTKMHEGILRYMFFSLRFDVLLYLVLALLLPAFFC